MYYNLRSIERFTLWSDIGTMFRTVIAVCGKEYKADIQGENDFVNQLQLKKEIL